jgi:hypothetical protein
VDLMMCLAGWRSRAMVARWGLAPLPRPELDAARPAGHPEEG